MSLRKYLMKIPFIENMYIQNTLDYECEKYFNKIELIRDSFLRKFFLQIINCSRVGVFELHTYIKRNFTGIRTGAVIDDSLRNNFRTAGSLSIIFKWISVYHISRFLRENSSEIDNSAIFASVSDLFMLSEADFDSLLCLTSIPINNAVEYEIKFSGIFMSKALQKQTNTPVMLALIDNFFYNSYKEFLSGFTTFVTLGSSKTNNTSRNHKLTYQNK